MYGKADCNPNTVTRLACDHFRSSVKVVVVTGSWDEFGIGELKPLPLGGKELVTVVCEALSSAPEQSEFQPRPRPSDLANVALR